MPKITDKKIIVKKAVIKKPIAKKPILKKVVKENMTKPLIKNGRSLVIVESPGKIKTISKYLGADYTIKASIGHITGLSDKNMPALIKKNFEPGYEVDDKKKKVVSELKKLVKEHSNVILATDEDREWEAIAYQLATQLWLNPKTNPRIVFNEITKPAIEKAIANPRIIDMDMVNAQKWRAVLDKLVWFSISPVLWSKVKMWLSAGRVQSVAVKLIVQKERQILSFKPQEFWTLESSLFFDKSTNINIYLKKFKNINIKENYLNFTDTNIFNEILDGKKTIDLRALNPEEKNRYFDDITIWQNIKIINKTTNVEEMVIVTNIYKWNNLTNLFEEWKDIFAKIRPNLEIDTFEKLTKQFEFTPDYIHKANTNWIIWFEIEVVENDDEDVKNLSGSRFPKSTIDQIFSELQIIKKDIKSKTDIKTNNENIYIEKKIDFELVDIIKKESYKNPSAPFATSTLQQTASRVFGRPVKSVMSAAQKLYEAWLITYMRTDSTSISSQAINDIKKYIYDKFGEKYSHEKQYTSKSKTAQEAHEAIRPTNISVIPETVKLWQYETKLYDLIWRRTLASQMSSGIFDSTTYIREPILSNNQIWQTIGKVMKFDGWLKILKYEDDDIQLPYIDKKHILTNALITAKQNQTKPPARFTEASLVKILESKWIGRPSTYASTITTIQDRWYITKDNNKLKPTEIAFSVNDFLEKYFDKLMDYDFTAKMENNLDDIANGNLDRQKMLQDFYVWFESELAHSKTSEKVSLAIGKICPKCNVWQLVVRFSKGSKQQFVWCDQYPECDYVESWVDANSKLEELKAKYEWLPCPDWGTIIVKTWRFWAFLTSTEYPTVKWIKSPKQYEAEVNYIWEKPLCPICSKSMVMRSSRRGSFWGCSDYPNCNGIVAINNK